MSRVNFEIESFHIVMGLGDALRDNHGNVDYDLHLVPIKDALILK